MAMHDWNGNVNKNDIFDNFTEFQIYQNCTKGNNVSRSASNSSGGGFWTVFIIACIASAFSEIFGVLIIIGYGWLKLMGM